MLSIPSATSGGATDLVVTLAPGAALLSAMPKWAGTGLAMASEGTITQGVATAEEGSSDAALASVFAPFPAAALPSLDYSMRR